MSVPLSPYGTWRSSDLLDMSSSTNASSNRSFDSLISDQSSSAMSTSLNGFDIASLIQSSSVFPGLGPHRSISAPATYRALSQRSTLSPMTPSMLHHQRLPPEYLICGLTPPPSPTFHMKQEEQMVPSPKRQNSQPSPNTFDVFRSGSNQQLPVSTLASHTQYSGEHGFPHGNSSISSTLTNASEPCQILSSQDTEGGSIHERTASGKRKRIEDDYVMIEPVNRENSVQQEMRALFEEIVQTRSMLNQLKTAQGTLTKRKEKSRLNSSLDRKIKRFKEMRLTFLESCLTMEHASLRNVLDKAMAELEFCKNKGIQQTMSDGLAMQIDDALQKSMSGDIKSFFAASIGISDNVNVIIEEE